MEVYKYLKVFYNDTLVGTLAKTPERLVAFEYDNEWLNNGFSISPFSLHSKKRFSFQKLNRLTVYLGYLTIVCLMVGEDCLLTGCF